MLKTQNLSNVSFPSFSLLTPNVAVLLLPKLGWFSLSRKALLWNSFALLRLCWSVHTHSNISPALWLDRTPYNFYQRAIVARVYVMYVYKSLCAYTQPTSSLHRLMQNLPHCSNLQQLLPSPMNTEKHLERQKPMQCLISWSFMMTSHNKSACEWHFPGTVAMKGKSGDPGICRPVPRRDCLRTGGNCRCHFLKNRLDK